MMMRMMMMMMVRPPLKRRRLLQQQHQQMWPAGWSGDTPAWPWPSAVCPAMIRALVQTISIAEPAKRKLLVPSLLKFLLRKR